MIAVIKHRSNFPKADIGDPFTYLQWVEMFPNKSFVNIDYTVKKAQKKYGRHNYPDMLYVDAPELYHADTYEEMANELDNLIEQYNITEVVHVYTHHFEPYRIGHEEKLKNILNKCDEPGKGPGTFISIAKINRLAYIFHYLGKKVTSHHIVLDPLEGKFSSIVDKPGLRLTSYDMPEDDGIAFPYLQWANRKIHERRRKDKRFVFGCAINDQREYLYEQLNSIKHKEVKIFFKYKKENIDTLIKRLDYQNLVKRSEFTLMIKSWSGKHFSSGRFWESLFLGCIPICLDDSKWEDELKYYPQLFKVFRDNLVTSMDDLADFIDNLDYDRIIKLIDETDDWQNLLSDEWYYEKAKVLQFTDTDVPTKVFSNALF